MGRSAPVPFYPSTVIEISDGVLVRATCPLFALSRELMTHALLAAEERSFCDARKDSGGSKRPWRLSSRPTECFHDSRQLSGSWRFHSSQNFPS